MKDGQEVPKMPKVPKTEIWKLKKIDDPRLIVFRFSVELLVLSIVTLLGWFVRIVEFVRIMKIVRFVGIVRYFRYPALDSLTV